MDSSQPAAHLECLLGCRHLVIKEKQHVMFLIPHFGDGEGRNMTESWKESTWFLDIEEIARTNNFMSEWFASLNLRD